jgi:hypothetical protein
MLIIGGASGESGLSPTLASDPSTEWRAQIKMIVSTRYTDEFDKGD